MGDGGGTGSSTTVLVAEAALTRAAVACSAPAIATTVAVCAETAARTQSPGSAACTRACRIRVRNASALAALSGSHVVAAASAGGHAPQRLGAPLPKQRQCFGGCDTDAPRRMRLAGVCGTTASTSAMRRAARGAAATLAAARARRQRARMAGACSSLGLGGQQRGLVNYYVVA